LQFILFWIEIGSKDGISPQLKEHSGVRMVVMYSVVSFSWRFAMRAVDWFVVGSFYWTDLAPDLVNSELEEQVSISV
jgi:hypothetical protein